MASSSPVFVLISGGWHTPSTYVKFTTALRSKGYEIHVPALPSMNGSRPPDSDLNTDTSFIRTYVSDLINSGLTVIVLMHSYGGQVGTNALYGLGLNSRKQAGLSGGISHLVYITASALLEKVSMIDTVIEFGHKDLIPLAFDFAPDQAVLYRNPKMGLIGDTPGVSDEEVEHYVDSLMIWNGKCMYDPLTHCAWREIPVVYVYTLADMTVPLDYQKSFVAGMEKEGVMVTNFELNTGHSPMLTATTDLVDIVVGVAQKS